MLKKENVKYSSNEKDFNVREANGGKNATEENISNYYSTRNTRTFIKSFVREMKKKSMT